MKTSAGLPEKPLSPAVLFRLRKNGSWSVRESGKPSGKISIITAAPTSTYSPMTGRRQDHVGTRVGPLTAETDQQRDHHDDYERHGSEEPAEPARRAEIGSVQDEAADPLPAQEEDQSLQVLHGGLAVPRDDQDAFRQSRGQRAIGDVQHGRQIEHDVAESLSEVGDHVRLADLVEQSRRIRMRSARGDHDQLGQIGDSDDSQRRRVVEPLGEATLGGNSKEVAE